MTSRVSWNYYRNEMNDDANADDVPIIIIG